MQPKAAKLYPVGIFTLGSLDLFRFKPFNDASLYYITGFDDEGGIYYNRLVDTDPKNEKKACRNMKVYIDNPRHQTTPNIL